MGRYTIEKVAQAEEHHLTRRDKQEGFLVRDTQSLENTAALATRRRSRQRGSFQLLLQLSRTFSFTMLLHHSKYASFNRYELQIVKG